MEARYLLDDKHKIKLYIPDESKLEIFDCLNRVLDYKSIHERKRRKVIRFFQDQAVHFGLRSAIDSWPEWEKCIKLAESQSPTTILEYWKCLIKTAGEIFYFDEKVVWELRELPTAVYTALAKSIFIQLNLINDIHECAHIINEKISGIYLINWDQIDTSQFARRVKQDFSAYLTVMKHPTDSRLTNKYLCDLLGLTINDFTYIYFSPKLMVSTGAISNESYFLNRDMIDEIASYLNGASLHNFRQASRHVYNFIEVTYKHRITHRMHFYSNSSLLQVALGNILYQDNQYLLTDTSSHYPYNYEYRVTSLGNPYETASFPSRHGQFDRMIGGYVFKRNNKEIIILTAYLCTVHNSCFIVQQLIVDSLIEKPEREDNEEMKVLHDVKKFNAMGYRKPTWDRRLSMKVEDEQVTVDVTFTMREKHSIFSPSERWRAQFEMKDFESSSDVEVQAHKCA